MKQKSYVHCLKDYLDWVADCHNDGGLLDEPVNDLFFRGHADFNWELKPSIWRDPYCENDILNKAKTRGWQYFKDCRSELEMLITMQHFELPTRLLDVTTNPLVAIYFACQRTNKKANGCIMFGHHKHCDGRLFAEMVSHIIFQSDSDFLREKQITYLKTHFDNCDLSKKSCKEIFSEPLFFFPPYTNSRIIAQSGAFIMSALIDKNSDEENFIRRNEHDKASSVEDLFNKEIDRKSVV